MSNLVELSIPTPAGDTNARAQAALASANALSIATVEQYEAAAGELQAIKGKWNEIEEQRKALVKPIDEARKRLQAFFSGPLGFLEQAEAILKRKLVGFQTEQERLRREEQAKADEAARKEREKLAARAAKAEQSGKVEKAEQLAAAAASVAAPIMQREVPKVAGIKTREVWLFEITDAALVPREYLVVDESRVRRVVQALKADTKIPGVRVYADKSLASRAN